MNDSIRIIVVCAFAAVAVAVHAQNLVVNGSFEQTSPLVAPNSLVAGGQGTAPCDRTNKGTDFWLAFPGNYAPDPANQPKITLCIVGPVGTIGLVTIPGPPLLFSTNFTIMPPAVGTAGRFTVTLPSDADLADVSDQVVAKGVHLTASAEVAVFGMNYVEFTSDSFLALPKPMWGKEYVVLGYTNVQDTVTGLNGSQFAMVAGEAATLVTITPSVTTGSHAGGVPYNIALQQGEAYQLRNTNAGADLSGTIITANKPIAVFGGHPCANIQSSTTFFCNTLVEQLLPVTLWGTEFATVPLASRDSYTVRVVAAQNNTLVKTNGIPAVTLNRGQWFERVVAGPALVTANNPVFVAQYSPSSDWDDNVNADPFMVTVPPVTLFGTTHMFCVPANGFPSNFVNVVVNGTSLANLANVLLDGFAISNPSVVLNTYPNIGGGNMSGMQVKVTPGVHRLSSSSPFTAMAYGYDKYNAYAHPVGMGPGCPTQCLSISCPGNIVITNCLAVVPDITGRVSVSNKCVPASTLTIIQAPAANTPVAPGTVTVTITVTATDPAGHSATCQTTVAVASPTDWQWQWAVHALAGNDDHASAIALDATGGEYVTGTYNNVPISFGALTLPNAGNSDIFIAKLDHQGNFLWAKNGGGINSDSGRGIAVGNQATAALTAALGPAVYVVGTIGQGPAQFGAITLTGPGGFIAKLDAQNGNFIWVRKVDADLTSVALSSQGNVFVTGSFAATIQVDGTTLTSQGGLDVFMARFSSAGILAWATRAGGVGSDVGSGIAVDESGRPYVTGSVGGTATFGAQTLPGFGDNDVFVACLDAGGTFSWARHAGGSGDDRGSSIAVAPSGSAQVIGSYSTGALFGSTVPGGLGGLFVSRFDQSGNFLWTAGSQSQAPGVSYVVGTAIAIDGLGRARITGEYRGMQAAFGPFVLPIGSGGGNIFTVQLNSSGQFLNAQFAGGNIRTAGLAIAVDANGCEHIAGLIRGTTTFGTLLPPIMSVGNDALIATLCSSCSSNQVTPAITITTSSVSEGIVLAWPPGGTLQETVDLIGPFKNTANAKSPYVVQPTAPGAVRQRFFRVLFGGAP